MYLFHLLSQDDANKEGGKWIVRLKKGLASRCWENLILAVLGEQFMVGDEICGAVISIRFQVSRKLTVTLISIGLIVLFYVMVLCIMFNIDMYCIGES